MGLANFLYVVKLIDDREDPLKSAKFTWMAPLGFSSWPSETATRSAHDHSDCVMSEASSSENFDLPKYIYIFICTRK